MRGVHSSALREEGAPEHVLALVGLQTWCIRRLFRVLRHASTESTLTLLVNAAVANLQRYVGGFYRGASLALRAFKRHMQDHFFIRF